MESTCDKLLSKYSWIKHKFDFAEFFEATRYNGTALVNLTELSCPTNDSFFKNTPFLTNEACETLAGDSWNPYPTKDVLTRLMTWKGKTIQIDALFESYPKT